MVTSMQKRPTCRSIVHISTTSNNVFSPQIQTCEYDETSTIYFLVSHVSVKNVTLPPYTQVMLCTRVYKIYSFDCHCLCLRKRIIKNVMLLRLGATTHFCFFFEESKLVENRVLNSLRSSQGVTSPQLIQTGANIYFDLLFVSYFGSAKCCHLWLENVDRNVEYPSIQKDKEFPKINLVWPKCRMFRIVISLNCNFVSSFE